MECSDHRRTLLESSSTTGPIHNAVQSSECFQWTAASWISAKYTAHQHTANPSHTADDVTTWTRSLPVIVELHHNHRSLAAKVQGVKTRNGFGPPSQSVVIEDSSTIDWPCSVSDPYIISVMFEQQKTFWGFFRGWVERRDYMPTTR